MQTSIFDVLPTDVMLEVIAAMPAEDVSNLVSTCSTAADMFTKDKMVFYDWVTRYFCFEQALLSAIIKSDPVGLRRLLDKAPKSFDVNKNAVVSDVNYVTLLHLAVAHGHMPCLHELLRVPGIDINRAVLHMAVKFGQALSAAVLLDLPGVDPNVLDDEDGQTALHLACTLGDAAIAALIAQHPSTDVNALDGDGVTPLHAAVHELAGAEVLELLLRHPRADVNARDREGWTALHAAASCASTEVMRVLVAEPRVDVNVRDPDGYTALHKVAMVQQVGGEEVLAAARVLLAAPGVDVNAQTPDGYTPLHFAAGAGNVELAVALARTPGVNVGVVNRWGKTAREYALVWGSYGVWEALGDF